MGGVGFGAQWVTQWNSNSWMFKHGSTLNFKLLKFISTFIELIYMIRYWINIQKIGIKMTKILGQRLIESY